MWEFGFDYPRNDCANGRRPPFADSDIRFRHGVGIRVGIELPVRGIKEGAAKTAKNGRFGEIELPDQLSERFATILSRRNHFAR